MSKKKSKTVTFDEFKERIISKHSKLDRAIVGKKLLEYVGIGWITIRAATPEDFNKYPTVKE